MLEVMGDSKLSVSGSSAVAVYALWLDIGEGQAAHHRIEVQVSLHRVMLHLVLVKLDLSQEVM